MEIVEATADRTRPLRLAVLRPGYPSDTPTLKDPAGAVHLAAREGDTVIGSAVVVPAPFPARPEEPALQLQGMAVAPDRQGTGVGGRLLDGVLRVARERGVPLVWCNARTTAVGFYARHGWRVEGEEFTGAIGLPHFLMWRPVEPAAPPTSS